MTWWSRLVDWITGEAKARAERDLRLAQVRNDIDRLRRENDAELRRRVHVRVEPFRKLVSEGDSFKDHYNELNHAFVKMLVRKGIRIDANIFNEHHTDAIVKLTKQNMATQAMTYATTEYGYNTFVTHIGDTAAGRPRPRTYMTTRE